MTTRAICLLMGAASAALAQSPSFEAAAIRPATSMAHLGVTVDRTRLDMRFQTLSDLIVRAYGVSELRIAGPARLGTEHFEIQAKMPEGASPDQVPAMLRTLLAERFGMTMHRENREMPIYALMVGKAGLKMKPGDPAEAAPEPRDGDRTSDTVFGKMTVRMGEKGLMMFGPGVGVLKSSMGPNGIHIEMSNLTIARLVGLLEETSDRIVIDKTGLTGSYQAATDIQMDMAEPGGMSGLGGVNPMMKSVEQMGLRLEAQKSLVEMIVIDHIEKTPTEN